MFNCSSFKALEQKVLSLSLALLHPSFKVMFCILLNQVQTKESLDQSSVSSKTTLLAISEMDLSFQTHHWVHLHLLCFWGNNPQLCLKLVADASGNLKPSLGPRQSHVLRAVQWRQALPLRQALQLPEIECSPYTAGTSALPPGKKINSLQEQSGRIPGLETHHTAKH